MADSTPHSQLASQPEEEWPVVWEQHRRWLQTVLTARLADLWAVDDCLQEVAASAFRHYGQLEDRTKIAPWLYRIAIREVCRFRKRFASKLSRFHVWDDQRLDELPSAASDDPLDWMIADEVVANVQQCLRRLPPQDREMLMLKHAENWTYQRIAADLGLSPDKVIYRLARARERLRLLLLAKQRDWVVG